MAPLLKVLRSHAAFLNSECNPLDSNNLNSDCNPWTENTYTSFIDAYAYDITDPNMPGNIKANQNRKYYSTSVQLKTG